MSLTHPTIHLTADTLSCTTGEAGHLRSCRSCLVRINEAARPQATHIYLSSLKNTNYEISLSSLQITTGKRKSFRVD